jgi:hypothetical protein
VCRGRGSVDGSACYLPTVRLTLRHLNRATLARQFLLARERRSTVDAVRRLLALQAQEPASPYLALWSRLEGFDPAELDDAFRSFAVVKASLMRITLHAVAADDRGPIHEAMRTTLRAAGLHDARFRSTGLTAADADALVPALVDFARRPRRRPEIEAMLSERMGAPAEPGVWRALRMIAPLVHAPAAAPWSFGRVPAYVAAPDAEGAAEPDTPPAEDRMASLQRLVLRYLAAFGPATRSDFAQFALLRQPEVGPAFEALGDAIVALPGPERATLYDLPGAPLPDADTPAPPRLLAMWDSVLMAYADRSRIIPPEYRPHVIRRNGDVLPTLLVDGFVAGVWRLAGDGVEVTAFHELAIDAWDGIEREARGLRSVVAGRDGATYGRFGHWWAALPGVEVRVVGRGEDGLGTRSGS